MSVSLAPRLTTKRTAEELPDYIERVTRKFDEQRLDGELFAQWTQRADEEDLR